MLTEIYQTPQSNLSVLSALRGRSTRGWRELRAAIVPLALFLIWLLVVLGVPSQLPMQAASWLTFIALLITPGYFLADLITWRLDLDTLERLALAFPLGIAVLAVPGTIALVQHLTIDALVTGWTLASAAVFALWLVHGLFFRALARLFDRARYPARTPWAADEIIMLLLLVVAFVAITPTLSLNKIDGDAYAVGTFAADALAGLPLNQTEPLFGTDLGPGVRMIFNQSLPLSYLWSSLSGIDPIPLTANASRAMIALWAILAAYTFGKAAGGDSRRFGLFVAAIQLLIYIAAPFLRGDNVSLFFFERTNADKFMVPVTMLPVVFAFAIRTVRSGRVANWLAAAIATFAVSTIHPLIAAMLALALGAFGGLHLTLAFFSNKGEETSSDPPPLPTGHSPPATRHLPLATSFKRTLALAGLAIIVMILPVVQLALSRGEAPLAPSYPSSFEGWPLGERKVPVLPFVNASTLDLYGPLPDVSQLDAAQVNDSDNPFLIWRFAVNMNRRRLLFFDIDSYISDPSVILEPPYLLAILLLPLLIWGLRKDVGAQFAVSTTLAVLFIMFNPVLTPLLGSLVMPWILWRWVWILPYALIIALAAHRLLTEALPALLDRFDITRGPHALRTYGPLAFILLAGIVLSPGMVKNIQTLNDRAASPYFYPTPQRIFDRLNELTEASGRVTVLADQDLSVTIPATVAHADVVAHRVPTTSEVFPADRQEEALQRLIDQDAFFSTSALTTNSIDILRRYDVRYVVTPSGSDVDMQLRLAPQWFRWLLDDQSYSLYAVHKQPLLTAAIQGNTALVKQDWSTAEAFYQEALDENPDDLLALVGMAEIAHAQGRFDEALATLQDAIAATDLPVLHYHLGQLYAERGEMEASIAQFEQAQAQAPGVARFHVALGDACLTVADETCAAEQYAAAVAHGEFPDEASRLIAEGDLWRQRGRPGRALPFYEQAVALRPNTYNQFVLESAYREAGAYDEAEALIADLRRQHPLSGEVVEVSAALMAAQEQYDAAVDRYEQAIFLRNMQVQESVETRLALAQVLLDAGRVEDADEEIATALELQPYNAAAHRLRGDVQRRQQNFDEAIAAYQRAFALDPTRISVYLSLSEQVRQHSGSPDDIQDLLQTAIRVNPDEATLLLARGDQLQRMGSATDAIDVYQAALEKLDPYALSTQLRARSTAQSRAFVYARLAAVYEDRGQIGTAMDYYRAVVAAAPEYAWPHVTLGDALRRRADPAGAKASYERALEQDAAHVDAYVRLADLYYAQGDVDEADALYDEALQIAQAQASQNTGASSVNAVVALARLYQATGQTDQAIDLYQQRLAQGEDEGWSPTILAQYHKSLGDLYLSRNQLDRATDAYRQAVDLDSWWPEARLGLAEALTGRGEIATALTHLETAVAIAPGSVEAQVALANALEQRGENDAALTIFRETAEDHPGNAFATLALARALQEREQWDVAADRYQSTLAMTPNTADAYIGLAEIALVQGQYADAEDFLREARDEDGQNIEIYVRMGEVEQRQGNTSQALYWYRQAARVLPAGQTINVTLIDSLLQYGHYDVALATVEEALARQPENGELWLQLGRIQRQLGRTANAESSLLRARRLTDVDARPDAELAQLYLAQGQPQTALTFYQQAIGREPDDVSHTLNASQVWVTQGRFDQALAVLEDGLTKVPRPGALYARISTLYLRQGKPEQALAVLEEGIADAGETTQLLLALGGYYESRALFEDAEAQYNRALEREPNLAIIQAALADFHLHLGEMEEALAAYKQATVLEPTNPGHFLALGDAYRRDEQPEEAATAYQQALDLAPTLGEAYASLAGLYQEQEQPDDARATYEQGLTVVPTSVPLLTQYSAFLRDQGEEEAALALLEEAPTAALLIARASAHRELGQVDEAIQDLETALSQEPGALDALIALGDLYRDQEEYDKAQQTYEEAVALMPGVPIGYLRLGGLANDQGDREQAEAYVAAAREAEPGSLLSPP